MSNVLLLIAIENIFISDHYYNVLINTPKSSIDAVHSLIQGLT